MIIYTYSDHDGWNTAAFSSLKKAKAHRATTYPRGNRPPIYREVIVTPINKRVICNLINGRDYATSVEVAG